MSEDAKLIAAAILAASHNKGVNFDQQTWQNILAQMLIAVKACTK